MKRRTVVLAAVALTAVVVLAFGVPLLLDAERYRPSVEERLSSALGRPVGIGKLRFSLLAGGIAAQDISIAEDPAFGRQPFLTAKALDVNVALMPLLLHRELNIQSVTVRQPDVRLVQRDGRWNFASLGASRTAKPSAPGPKSSAAAFQLQRLAINGGKIVVASSGASQTYDGVSFDLSEVRPGSASPLHLQANTPGGGKLKAEGTVGPLQDDMSKLPAQLNLNLENLELASSGYFGANPGLGGLANIKGTLRSDGRTAHVEGRVKADKLRLAKDGTPAAKPVTFDFSSDYDLAHSNARLTRGDLNLGKSVAHLTGNVNLRGIPAVDLALALPSMAATDIQQLLPPLGVSLPGGASLQSGTASTNLAIGGPIDRLVIAGPVKLSDITVGGFDLGAKMKGIGALAGINTGPATRIQSLVARLRRTPEATAFDDINAVIAGVGAISGNGSVAANNALDFRLVAHLSNAGGVLGGILQSANIGQLSTVPFHIQGTTSDPRFTPDVNAIVQTRPSNAQPDQAAPTPLGGVLQQLFRKKK